VAGEGRVEIEAWGITDVGRKRRLNEDVFVIDEKSGVYLVADGMGGHAAGEVASRIAAEAILNAFAGQLPMQLDKTWPEHWNIKRSAAANLLVDAVRAGHSRVTMAVDKDLNLKGMGTTVVAAVLPPESGKLIICHVGDSRAYRVRGAELQLLTRDHSWVHEQVEAGFLTEEAARSHPLKNVVTQALGGSSEPKVDILETEILPDDLYILCSDGLNSMLDDEEIYNQVVQGGTLEDIGQRLVVKANENGGNDNITVVLFRANTQA